MCVRVHVELYSLCVCLPFYAFLPHSFWLLLNATYYTLCCSIPLACLGAAIDRRVRVWLAPVMAFVVLYSFLPHKVSPEDGQR